MSYKIAHVDDSNMSRRLMRKALEALSFPVLVLEFESGAHLIRALEAGEKPDLILSDYNMPRMTGAELVREIKRHPQWHGIPVVMISAESHDVPIQQAKAAGARVFVAKPIEESAVRAMVESVRNDRSVALPFVEFDGPFAAESVETIREIVEAVSAGREGFESIALRGLHTIKGNAFSLHWPLIGDAIHQVEDLLKASQSRGTGRSPRVRELLIPALEWIRSACRSIEHGVPHELRPEPLWSAMADEAVRLFTEGKARLAEPKTAPDSTDATRAATAGAEARAASVRVTTDKLDALQSQIKSIQQARARLSGRLRLVAQEFESEPFVAELERAAQEIGESASQAMDFFLAFRLVSIARLARFAESCASEAARESGKQIDFVFLGDEAQEIDRQIVEILERAVLHFLRNAVDHGIESAGRVEVRVERVGASDQDGTVRVTVSDDGRGIDLVNLARKAESLGLLSPSALASLPKDKLLDFIFIDGVTTKTEASRLSGRGVGLAAVRSEVTGAGGSVKVETGNGTRFTVEIPRRFKL